MEVWIFAILIGIWFSVLLLGAGVLIGRGLHDKGSNDVADKGMDERKPVLDSSSLSGVQRGCSDRSGNQSDYLGLDDEAVRNILYVMRMSVRYCDTERLAIDYCIDRLEAENG